MIYTLNIKGWTKHDGLSFEFSATPTDCLPFIIIMWMMSTSDPHPPQRETVSHRASAAEGRASSSRLLIGPDFMIKMALRLIKSLEPLP
jgi:hypothetical protein